MRRSNVLLQVLGIVLMLGSIPLIVGSEAASSRLGYGLVSLGLLLMALSGPLTNWTIIVLAASANGFSVPVEQFSLRPEYLAFPLILLLAYQVRKCRSEFSWQRGLTTLGISGGIYVLWSLVISSSAPSPLSSYFVVVQYAVGLIALWILLKARIDRAALVRRGTLVLGCISLINIVGYAAAAAGLEDAIGVSSSGRSLGFSFEPNIYASQAVLWLGVMYYWRRSLTPVTKLAGLLILITVFTAGTRAAWLALGAMALVILLQRSRKNPVLISLYSGLAVVAAVIFPAIWSVLIKAGWVGSEISYRMENLLELESGTGSYRLSHYDLAFENIATEGVWLHGFGANTFSQYHPIDSTGTGPAYLGSLWITLIYDSGFIGLILFVIALGAVFVFSRKRSEAIVILVAISICAAFTNFMWFQYAWLSIAMLQPLTREVPSHNPNKQKTNLTDRNN